MGDEEKSGTPEQLSQDKPVADEPSADAPVADKAPQEGAVASKQPASSDTSEEDSNPGRKRGIIITLVAVLVVAALAAASYWAYQTITDRREATERLAQATQFVEDADVVVIEVDEIVRTPIEVSVGVRAEAALDMVPDAEADLEEALSLIEKAEPALSEEDALDASALSDSAEARLEMLDHGSQILEANIKAAGAMEHALAGWDAIIESEDLSDAAVKEYNKLTDSAVKKSKKLAGEAQAKANEAKTSFEDAQKAFPEADFSAFIAYAEGKSAALAISIKADDAYLADKPTDANKLNDQYNDAEKDLIKLAKSLPASPVEPIKVAYEEIASEMTEAYYAARDRATASDALLQGGETDEE